MAGYNLTPQDVISALNAQNVQVAAGSAGVPPQLKTQTFELGILVNGRLSKVSDFENVIVKTVPATGNWFTLKMWQGWNWVNLPFPAILLSMENGLPACLFTRLRSNALETANGIYKVLAQLKKSFPSDVDYNIPFESVTVVKVSMNDVVVTLLKALGLVALVVFLFLQSPRSTLIPVLAIPVSILGTFIFSFL